MQQQPGHAAAGNSQSTGGNACYAAYTTYLRFYIAHSTVNQASLAVSRRTWQFEFRGFERVSGFIAQHPRPVISH